MLFLHFQLFLFIIQNSVVLLGKEDQKQDTSNDINDSCNVVSISITIWCIEQVEFSEQTINYIDNGISNLDNTSEGWTQVLINDDHLYFLLNRHRGVSQSSSKEEQDTDDDEQDAAAT